MRDDTHTEIGKAQAAAPSWRDVLAVHPAANLFPRMAERDLRKLGDNIRERGLVSPIAIFREVGTDSVHYSLLDGINRLDAMEMAGIKFEFQFSKNGDWVIKSCELSNIDDDVVRCRYVCDDPFDFVLSANIHRRHLTAEQKRDLIEKVMKATSEKSDRQIAEQTKTSPSTVAKVRKELEQTGDVSKLDTRIDRKGRKQHAHKPVIKKRRDIDDFIAEKAKSTTKTVADRAEERSRQTERAATLVQEAAQAVLPSKQTDIEHVLPDADALVRDIMERDRIAPGYAKAVMLGLFRARPAAKPISSDDLEIPDFLKRETAT